MHPSRGNTYKPDPNKNTILVVDDEDGIRYVVSKMLEHAGFKVLTAADGWAALETMVECQDEILLIFLDIVMPSLDGEETYHAIRRISKDVKILLCSGYAGREVVSWFEDMDHTEFIQKPFNRAKLLNKVNSLLAPQSLDFEAG